QRRSPAMISKPSSTGRTRIGWRTPTSRIESARDAISSSPKCSRGWNRLGLTAATGNSWETPDTAPSPPPGGIRAPTPPPRPPLRVTAHLFRELAVRLGTARCGIEDDDRLAEGWRLGEPDRSRHDGLADAAAKVRSHLLNDLVCEAGAGVVHREDDPAHV